MKDDFSTYKFVGTLVGRCYDVIIVRTTNNVKLLTAKELTLLMMQMRLLGFMPMALIILQ